MLLLVDLGHEHASLGFTFNAMFLEMLRSLRSCKTRSLKNPQSHRLITRTLVQAPEDPNPSALLLPSRHWAPTRERKLAPEAKHNEGFLWISVSRVEGV